MLREIPESCVQLIVQQAGFVRVNANGRIDERMFIGEPKRAVVGIIRNIPVADADNDLDVGIERALNDGFAVGIEFAHLDV